MHTLKYLSGKNTLKLFFVIFQKLVQVYSVFMLKGNTNFFLIIFNLVSLHKTGFLGDKKECQNSHFGKIFNFYFNNYFLNLAQVGEYNFLVT